MSRSTGQSVFKLDVTGLNRTKDIWLSMTAGFACFEVRPDQNLDSRCESPSSDRAFFTAKIDTGDRGRTEDLIRRGFVLVETAVTFESVGHLHRGNGERPLPGAVVVKPATEDDLDAVETIAGSAFRHSRFHRDPSFPSAVADRIKQEWARNLVIGERGAGCLVGRRDGRVVSFVGYLQVEYPRPLFVIDLVAVSGEEQGRGIGRATVGAMQATATQHKRPVIVGTQLSNVASVRLYESMGFRLESSTYILHGHSLPLEKP